MKYLIDCLRTSCGGSVTLLAFSVLLSPWLPEKVLPSVPLYPVESSPVLSSSLHPHRDKLLQMHPIGAWLSTLLISR